MFSRIFDIKYLMSNTFSAKSITGVSTLPVVLIVSAIIMEVAITSVIVASVFGSATSNARIANESLAIAEAGANDGIIKVVRYCPIGSIAGTSCETPYQITVGARTANIIIKDDLAIVGDKIIISSSTILNRIKRIEVRLGIDQITGKTDIRSFKECYNYDNTRELCLD